MRSLRERWAAPGARELAVRVLERLAGGGPLDLPKIGQVDGKADLRGYQMPSPQRLRESQWRSLAVTELAGMVKVVGAAWRGLDMSGAVMDHLRLEDMRIENCKFDQASCLDLRMWRCHIADTSFVRADLRHAALGPWSKNRGNEYSRVDFTRADFRDASSLAASYRDCDFSYARLDGLDFKSSSLIRCRFAGVLREVVFDGRQLDYGKQDPNPMEDVDLSAATLQMVEFKGIDVGRVRLPDDPGLRIIDNYPCVLNHAIEALNGRDDVFARGLRRQLSDERKMLTPGQQRGVFNRNDMFLIAKMIHQNGDDLAAFADEVIGEAEQICSAGN